MKNSTEFTQMQIHAKREKYRTKNIPPGALGVLPNIIFVDEIGRNQNKLQIVNG